MSWTMPGQTPSPTQRILRLLDLLQTRRIWSGPELADRLDVTTRTIRRDIDKLRELGYEVDGEQGADGGYRLRAGRELPPILLDDDEAIAIAVSLRAAATSPVSGVGEAAVRALAKLDQVFPKRLKGAVNAVHDVTTTLPRATAEVDPDILVTLARAARDHVRLRFDYTTRAGEAAERSVEPYRIVTTGQRWYLMAFDLERDDWRTFRLDRMSAPHATTFTFRPREAPDAAEYVQRSISRAGYRHEAVVRLSATPQAVRGYITPTTGTVEPEGDGSLVTVAADRMDGLAWHLSWIALALDSDLEVVSPPELNDALKSMADKIGAFAA